MPEEITPDEALEQFGIADESPEVDEDTFNLDDWIAGVQTTQHSVMLYQRADLLAEIDEVEAEYRQAKKVPESDRSMADASPEDIERRLVALYEKVESSAVKFRVQALSDEARNASDKALKDQGVKDETTLVMHQLEKAIVSPKGITVAHLRKLNEVSQPQMKMLIVAFQMACHRPPSVGAPLSRSSSDARSTARS